MRTIAFLLALIAAENAQAARILGLFPHTGKSHQMVFDPLLKTLAERGHHLTVVSFFPIKDPPANYTTVSLEGLSPLGLETVDLSFYEDDASATVLSLLGIKQIYQQFMDFQPLSDLALDVCSKLVDFQPLAEVLQKSYDIILVETFNSDCMLGLAHVYGLKAPFVSLLTSSMMHWCPDRIGVTDNPSYVPILSSEFTSEMSFMQRLENTFMNVYYKIWYRYAIQLKEKAMIEKRFGRRIPDLQDLGKNVTAMMLNTFHSLNGVRPLLPGVIEVGGMHLDPRPRAIPHYIERFLNESEHGVVLFSWGSLIKTATIPKYKEDIIINALSKIKQRVIWKYENSDEEGTLTGNILKVKWIPQYDLLQHKKVIAFIAHGGLLGMTEAVSAGKPMLIVPFYGDQPLNAASADMIGLGKVISYADLTEKTLLEGLQTVLSAEMRLSARRVSKIWHDRIADPLETAVYWVERIIRWGDSDPLHSKARDLSFIEYNLLDVVAVISVTFILFILIMWVVLNKMLRFISGSFHSKEKLH
ncbi:unnamed protein product [Arctia plantaginis]|uniref:UDP-glucuronosyltransferase n=1 Tax=Arctia plantaginis TaxID=874455 RepID=A0A8S0YSW8_ARCPL|nr:unnamed protein product [Arctia plantaginis]CAB3255722.1 unnamed protein product [Arctia plantaginis]